NGIGRGSFRRGCTLAADREAECTCKIRYIGPYSLRDRVVGRLAALEHLLPYWRLCGGLSGSCGRIGHRLRQNGLDAAADNVARPADNLTRCPAKSAQENSWFL